MQWHPFISVRSGGARPIPMYRDREAPRVVGSDGVARVARREVVRQLQGECFSPIGQAGPRLDAPVSFL
jgi:hypothetical protein